MLAPRTTLLAAASVALVLAGGARAFVPIVPQIPHGPKGTAPGIVLELHATKALLEKADHDYEGHRAAAVHHITQAIHELSGAHHGGTHAAGAPHHAGGKHPHPGKGGQKGHEPQAVSDAQLRVALQQLAAIHAQLGGAHPKASGNIQAAIVELNVALKIK